jgi:DNA-binding transcriptional LysR family regulator
LTAYHWINSALFLRSQVRVVSSLANLEGQLGVKLFDRSGHLPALTDQGRALLANARAVAGDGDLLKARAKNFGWRS